MICSFVPIFYCIFSIIRLSDGIAILGQSGLIQGRRIFNLIIAVLKRTCRKAEGLSIKRNRSSAYFLSVAIQLYSLRLIITSQSITIESICNCQAVVVTIGSQIQCILNSSAVEICQLAALCNIYIRIAINMISSTSGNCNILARSTLVKNAFAMDFKLRRGNGAEFAEIGVSCIKLNVKFSVSDFCSITGDCNIVTQIVYCFSSARLTVFCSC